jgi:hypothetical protein
MGMKLIDQARDVFLRFRGKPVSPPAARAGQAEDPIMIRYRVEDLELDQVESVRYDALQKRLRFNWDIYHGLWRDMPLLGAVEREQTQVRMKLIRMELCTDFCEMQDIYQHNKGIRLDGHYMLHRFCMDAK